MRILVVAANRAREPLPVMPYGACIAAEAAERAGHEVRLLDLMFERRPLEALGNQLRHFHPGLVAFSVRNIDNNDMAAPRLLCSELRRLVATVRACPEVRTVIGGPAVGVMPRALLAFSGAEWAAVGDGERTFPALLAALEAGTSPHGVPGIGWLENGELRLVSREPEALPPRPEVPDFRRWIRLGAYRSRMAPVPLQTKRGCPHACVYCTYSVHEGREHRLYSADAVAEAVARLADDGCRDIELVDNVFNSPYGHAMEICDALALSRSRARLTTLEINPGFVDRPLLEAMEHAGFAGIGLTAESASERVLAGLGRNYGPAELHAAAEAVGRSRLPCLWIFMLGGPGETETSAAATVAFAERHVRPGDAAYFGAGVRIYPGTELERRALTEGVLDRPAEDALEPIFYFSPELSPGRARDLIAAATRRNPGFMNSAAFVHPLLPAATRVAAALGLRPPLWRHTRTIRRIFGLIGRDIYD